MKIVYVYPSFVQLAGTERVFTDKMNYLAEHAGYEVFLLTYEQGSHSFPFYLSSDVHHIDLNVRFFLLYRYNRFVRWYKEWILNRQLNRKFNEFVSIYSPDIVVAPSYFAKVLFMIASCPSKFVRIVESHIDKRFIYHNNLENRSNFVSYIRALLEARIVKKSVRRFDLLVTLNSEDAKDWAKLAKTIVVPNVVHLSNPGKFSTLNNKRVIFAGRLVEQKGLFDLLKIWELVYRNHMDWQLEIYGEGPLREEMINYIKVHKIGAKIHEPTPDILDKFCDSSIFVLTSLYEPFGLVLVEAMSCGLPVVSFDCPNGPSEIIKDGIDGFLIRDRDTFLFAKRLEKLMESYELRKKLGSTGIISSQKYSSQNIMPIWLHLFDSIIDEKRKLD